MKKICIVLGKGLEGCGITTGAIEQYNRFIKNGYDCSFYFCKEKKYGRSKIRLSKDYKEFSINKYEDVLQEINSSDIVIFHSFPNFSFDKKTIDNFTLFLRSIEKPIKVGYMHELYLPNVKSVPSIFFNEIDVIYSFSTESYFSNYIGSIYTHKKQEGRILRYEMGIDIEKISKFKKTYKEKINQILYMGRFSTIKDPLRLGEYFKKGFDYKLKMIGIERSIGTKTMIIDKKDIYSYNSLEFNKKTNKDLEGIVNVYGSYDREVGFEEMSKSMFGASFYYVKNKHESGNRMEFTQIETICCGTIPLFDKRRGETNFTKDGRRFIDVENIGIFCDKDNIEETLEKIKIISGDENLYNKYIDSGIKFIEKEYGIDLVMNKLINTSLSLGVDNKKSKDEFSLIDNLGIEEFEKEILKNEVSNGSLINYHGFNIGKKEGFFKSVGGKFIFQEFKKKELENIEVKQEEEKNIIKSKINTQRIIIEGCDGTGKTTLINFIKSKMSCYLEKTSQPKTNNPFLEYIEKIDQTKNLPITFLFDRFWVGEHIYGPIYRGSVRPDEYSRSLLMLTEGDIYIICCTSDENIEKVFKERGEDFTKIEDIKRINSQFRDFYDKFKGNGNFFLYDFKEEGKDLESFYLKISNGS